MAQGFAGSGISIGPALAAGTQTALTGTAIFSNSNGISFGMSGSSRVTASYDAIKSISAGTTRITNNEAVFSDGGGVSFGANGQTVTASVGAGATATGNLGGISAAGGAVTSGTALFSNAGGVSFGVAGQTVTASVAAQSAQPGIQSISAGTTRATTGEVVFSNSNNVSFGLDGATVTGSASFAAETPFGVSAGTQSVSTGTLVFSNSNGISFGMSGSSRITASYTRNVASDAIQNVGSATGSGTNTSRFAADDHVHAGVAAFGISNTGTTLGNTGTSFGTWVLAASGNISASMSTGAAGVHTAWLSVPAGGGGGDVVAAGTQTATGGTVLFSDSNGISFGMSGSTRITASYTRNVASNAIQNVGSATGSGTNTSRFAADDHVHAGLNTVSVIGNTAGATTAGAGSLVLAGGPNITLSAATAAGGMTVSVSAGAAGGGLTYSSTAFGVGMKGPTSSSSALGQNTLYIWPHNGVAAVALSCIKVPVAITFSSSAAASVQRGVTILFGVYTRNATNSTVLTQHYSSSYTFAGSISSNTSVVVSAITGIGNSTSYNSATFGSAIGNSSVVHGLRELIIPWNTTLAAGEYWLAYVQSSSSAGAAGSMAWSNMVNIFTSGNKMGVAINATNTGALRNMMWGSYSATTGAMPAAISQTMINMSAIQPIVYGFHAVTE